MGIGEGAELVFIYDDEKAIVKPRKRIRVREFSGILGEAGEDEVEYAILDLELLPLYFNKKYRDKTLFINSL